MIAIVRPLPVALFLLALAGCTTTGISNQVTYLQLPEYWNQAGQSSADFQEDWLSTLPGSELQPLVSEALAGNYSWNATLARLDQSKANVVTSGADRFPSLSLGLSGNRRQNVAADDSTSISNSFSAGLNLNWELDVWGKLSDRQKSARLSYESTRADTLDSRRQLAADVASAWYNLIQAKQLLSLYEQRLVSLQQSQDVLERGYRSGLNEALDIYLGRNTLVQEQARTVTQRQSVIEATIQLQRLLGRYPDGQWELDAELPLIADEIPAGTPADLLTRRADILSAWLDLLAADADLAVAQKNRFPSISLSGSLSDSSSELDDLVNGGPLAWSLAGSLTQPLFQGGRLKAAEESSRARVAELEQNYLNTLFSAFADVEVTLNQAQALSSRYESLKESEETALVSYELSAEQYQRGLVEYTTLLESQRRAFDASASLIQLQYQMLQNRISLYLALGGSFDAAEQSTDTE